MRWAACGTRGWEGKAFRFLMVKRAGKIPHVGPRRRCEDKIEVDLTEMGWESVDYNNVAQDTERWQAVFNMEMKLWAPENMGHFLNNWYQPGRYLCRPMTDQRHFCACRKDLQPTRSSYSGFKPQTSIQPPPPHTHTHKGHIAVLEKGL